MRGLDLERARDFDGGRRSQPGRVHRLRPLRTASAFTPRRADATRLGLVALSIAVAPVAWSRTALATPQVTWDAPPECPTAKAVLDSFRRMHADDAAANGLEATVHVERADDGFDLTLSLRLARAANDLRLHAMRCDTLADAVALELALAADARVATTAVNPPDAHEEPAPTDRWAAAVLLGAAAGTTPAFAPGVRARLAYDTALVRLAIDATYLAPETATYSAVPGDVGARFNRITGGVDVCNAPGRHGLRVSACVGFEAGVLRGAGVDLEPAYTATAFWGAITATPSVGWAFGPGLTLLCEGQLELSMTRPEFHALNLGSLFVPDRSGATIWLGAETSL